MGFSGRSTEVSQGDVDEFGGMEVMIVIFDRLMITYGYSWHIWHI